MYFVRNVRFYLIVVLLQASDVEENNGRVQRIIGGIDAYQGEFPYQGALFYFDSGIQCGCSLIDSQWAITAAHCTHKKIAADLEVYFGEIDRKKMKPTSSNFHEVLEIHQHQFYENMNHANDISLLKLKKIEKSAFVSPIALPKFKETNNQEGKLCTITGWGKTKQNRLKLPRLLQKAEVPILINAQCQEMFRESTNKHIKILSGQVCAGFEDGGVDACQGDSGGPLACSSSSGIPVLFGITSFGYGCAKPSKPGIYTRVSHYLKWIYNITGMVESDTKIKAVTKLKNDEFLFYTIPFLLGTIMLLCCVWKRKHLLKLRKILR